MRGCLRTFFLMLVVHNSFIIAGEFELASIQPSNLERSIAKSLLMVNPKVLKGISCLVIAWLLGNGTAYLIDKEVEGKGKSHQRKILIPAGVICCFCLYYIGAEHLLEIYKVRALR